MMIVQHGELGETRVVDHFEATDLGAPFKVVLHNAVRVTFGKDGKAASYKIPDLEGLIHTVAITRVLHPRKLAGRDVKFVRKAIGVKQKDLAVRLSMTPEHLSRCEAGALVMSPTAETLFRIYAFKTAIKLHKLKSCEAKTKLEDALDKVFDEIKPVAAYDACKPLELHFSRSRPAASNDDGCFDETSGEWEEPAEAA